MNANPPNREQILEMAGSFMQACVLGAAAELDLFTAIGQSALTADALAEKLTADRRGLTMLLDAVAAMQLLDKQEGRYRVPGDLLRLLTEGSPENILPMIRHRINVMRGWSQLAWVAKAGIPGPRQASIRGAAADRAAFVAAMHGFSVPVADDLLSRLGPPQFERLLDVGGASGTWTVSFLRAVKRSRATIFDLPDAIAQARRRLAKTEFADRVTLVAGDFYVDDLPPGADYAWVSAIIHQHSRQRTRQLFGKVYAALQPGGRIGIRDVVMEASRTRPPDGAMFAINMLVNTETGGTFTFDEIAQDLEAAGFTNPQLTIKDEGMNSVVEATRP